MAIARYVHVHIHVNKVGWCKQEETRLQCITNIHTHNTSPIIGERSEPPSGLNGTGCLYGTMYVYQIPKCFYVNFLNVITRFKGQLSGKRALDVCIFLVIVIGIMVYSPLLELDSGLDSGVLITVCIYSQYDSTYLNISPSLTCN